MFQSNRKGRLLADNYCYSIVTLIVFIASCFYFQDTLAVRYSSKRLKYILLWTRHDYFPFSVMGEGRTVFVENGCPEANCYVTSDRTLFQGNLKKFDAIAFNGRNIHDLNVAELPMERSPHQRYIYFNQESAHNYPVCKEIYDNFFNWTATYRLDSDILLPYILIKKSAGDIVGPKMNMKWMSKTSLNQTTYEEFNLKVKKKSKAAAWFISNCNNKHRMDFARKLQESMDLFNLKIDIYGTCGNKTCPRGNPECDVMLDNDYYFYLSFENSCSPDYVTEKVLTALIHFTIPIVYGCADYSRFLPPFSYIDGNSMSTTDVAALMYRLMQSPKLYLDYMWWRDHYSYHEAFFIEDICNVCSALHNKNMQQKPSVYKDFRKWWYPNYENECFGIDSFIQFFHSFDRLNNCQT